MRNIKKLVPCILILLGFCIGINALTSYIYPPENYNELLSLEEMEEHEGEIETLLMGTSIVNYGMDSVLAGEILDSVCFNIATSEQPIASAYYTLKDQVKRNPVKRVFYGMNVKNFMSEDKWRKIPAKLRVWNYIESIPVKLQYFRAVGKADELEHFLFRAVNVENLFDFNSIKEFAEYKKSEDFKNKISPKGRLFDYYGMGFVANNKLFKGKVGKVEEKSIWDESKLREENIYYLRKLAELCEEEGIELNFVIIPTSKAFSSKQGDLADMNRWMREFCEEYQANLYDYNEVSCPEIYDLLIDTEDYLDAKHFNLTGARKFTKLVMTDYLEDHSES